MGSFPADPETRDAESDQCDECECAFPENRFGPSDITVGGSLERSIEPAEELSEQPFRAFRLGLEEKRGKRGAQGQRIEGREDYRDGDSYGELLVEPAR